MLLDDTIKTLTIERRDDTDGVWLCLDNGHISIPIAKFVSDDARQAYLDASAVAFAKAHTMGRMGI